MELKKIFLEQLEREGAASRKAIERVPEGQNSFKPHPRSMEMGYLAALVATMPGWVALMIDTDELDLDGDQSFRTQPAQSRAGLLSLLEKGMEQSCRALHNTTEEHLLKPWKLRSKARRSSRARCPSLAPVTRSSRPCRCSATKPAPR